MKIGRKSLLKFLKVCFCSGAFALLSLASFSMVYYFTTPEMERFVRFLKSDALWSWMQYNFFGWEALGISIMFISATLAASFVGLVSAVFAKALHDRAQDILKTGIGS